MKPATNPRRFKVAVEAPLKQIAVNAGLEGGVVAEKVRGLTPGEGPRRRYRPAL
jgi:chaperonin GroEL